MSESAEALAAKLTSRRNVTIEITNLTQSYCLTDPGIFLDSGSVHSPPQPTVRPLKTEVCNFGKISSKASGAVGVLTYNMYHKEGGTREKIAIMFSVPYDYGSYKNWLALGIFPVGNETNEDMYKLMYYEEKKSFVREEAHGCSLTYEGSQVDVKATMSPMGRAIMKVEVWDKLFSRPCR